MKIVRLPASDPKKFGPKRAHKKRRMEKKGQLNLFSGGRILKLHSQNAFEHALRLDEQGDKARARERYLQAIKNDDSRADAYCNLGIIEAEAGNDAQAVNHLTQSLKTDPRHYEAHFNLANIYAEQGSLELAKFHYEIAIEIEPRFLNSYFNLALTLALRDQYKEAIDVLEKYCGLAASQGKQSALELIRKFRQMQ